MSHYGTNVSATKPNISYSLNNGEWIDNWDGTNISLVAGDIIKMKGINPNGISSSYSNYSKFVITSGRFNASENIMSLIDGQKNGTKIIPGTEYCFQHLFSGCTSLAAAPALPATTLADRCYAYMFQYCTNLITAPELPVTTLTDCCYKRMFSDCTSLTAAPSLPATTLAYECYCEMFFSCTSLTTAPELPATTLADWCYGWMFFGCRNLNYIKCLATDISATDCTTNWVDVVSASGIFVKNPAMTEWSTGGNGIPSGWTVQDA